MPSGNLPEGSPCVLSFSSASGPHLHQQPSLPWQNCRQNQSGWLGNRNLTEAHPEGVCTRPEYHPWEGKFSPSWLTWDVRSRSLEKNSWVHLRKPESHAMILPSDQSYRSKDKSLSLPHPHPSSQLLSDSLCVYPPRIIMILKSHFLQKRHSI